MAARTPFWMESCPNDGPTVTFWITLTGAGSDPARRTIARSEACSAVKSPDLRSPPEILWMTGAEQTVLPRTIARRRFTFSAVTRSKIFVPRSLKESET
jgi:hypothetical protein